MEEKLKEIIRKYYEDWSKLPTPEPYQIGGTYYGRTELFSSVGNHMELVEDGRHTSYGYGGINTHYVKAFYIRIGGAYKISTKELKEELLAITGGYYVHDTKLGIIDNYGTNYSVIGFGYIIH